MLHMSRHAIAYPMLSNVSHHLGKFVGSLVAFKFFYCIGSWFCLDQSDFADC